jgi:hypothetical protein
VGLAWSAQDVEIEFSIEVLEFETFSQMEF